MESEVKELLCQCSCGQTELKITGQPKFRMLCHCSICQSFNQASYADILIYDITQVKLSKHSQVNFKTYKKPPNVQRGQCAECKQAVIEIFNMPLMPKLTMVPAKMFTDTVDLPEPKAHMFYDKRLKDAGDDLPKKSGFMSSQLTFFKFLWFGK